MAKMEKGRNRTTQLRRRKVFRQSFAF
ncbi:uncharacterized protein G2W53_020915 [Senna tora]|uniref:Uncharacterized protein n=1 Tax=Senna tora TaxID=362788 RepID=A0A834WKK9_9FABA|nr:uncharacterized protein G2W53_020915 [Senna tora]